MSFDESWAKATIASILAVGLGSNSASVLAAEPKLEKCYGIVKKGMNECGTPLHSCEGGATKDNDPAEWIYVLEGTCKKIVNGSLKPGKPSGAGSNAVSKESGTSKISDTSKGGTSKESGTSSDAASVKDKKAK